MCGIAGFTGPADASILGEMLSRLTHRGPDGSGTHVSVDPPLSMGMTRLSIIDIAGGAQPMSNQERTTWVVFNGEIFNAPELRQDLVAKGASFTSDHSDTEVLIHLYDSIGESMVQRLNGMFAFVLFDTKRRVLFGARDRLGIKPLYLSTKGGRLAFASELKAVAFLPWIDRELDPAAVSHYLTFQSIPWPRSPFHSIHKLPPGTYFSYHLDRKDLATKTYWCPSFEPPQDVAEHAAQQLVRSELEDAIKRWSISDVPVACSLSGGLDSSIVTALLAKQVGQKDLQTFTLGFEDAPDLDERALARSVATRWGTEHHEIVLSADDLLLDLDQMIWHLDEPYGGGLPSWFVFKAMGRHVKVAMTGVGGDELFGNYGKWAPYVSRRQRLRRSLRRPMTPWLKGALYHPRHASPRQKANLLLPEISHDTYPSEQLIDDLWTEAGTDDPKNAITYVDMRHQLPNEFLSMTDRFSMAHSVEARTPLLDHELIESVLRLPSRIRSPNLGLKTLLLNSAGDLLPNEVRNAPKKGFVLPMSRWLRGPLRPAAEDLLGSDYLRRQGVFRESARSSQWEPFLAGDDTKTTIVWTMLFFQLWHRCFVDGDGATGVQRN